MKQRIELAVYSNNTTLGSILSVEDILNFAKENHMPAVAITDLNSVQSFPEFGNFKNKQYEVKPIFGAKIITSDYHSDYLSDTTVLVKNNIGLKNLYHIISEFKHTNKVEYAPISIMEKYHEGLLFGCSDIYGPQFLSFADENFEYYGCYNDFFDYFEIKNFYKKKYEKEGNKEIVEIGKKINKPVVAVSDARYVDREDKICIEVLSDDELTYFENSYFRTTEEMLSEFSYLGEDANDVVVENTYKIAEQIEDVEVLPYLSNYNTIDNAYETIKQRCHDFVSEKYGDNPPSKILSRMENELNLNTAIEFADVFLLSADMVGAVKEQNEFAITRAFSASSFISYCLGISEINPIPPHYYCPKCKKVEWVTGVYSGYDLPDKICNCGATMHGDGQNICYETLFGYSGDKIPDIDLNFSNKGKDIAINKAKDILGKERLFWGGCTASVANEYSNINVKNSIEQYEKEQRIELAEREIQNILHKTELTKLFDDINDCALMVVPKDKDMFDFTPIREDSSLDLPISHHSYDKLWDTLFCCHIFEFLFIEQLKLLEQKTKVMVCDVPLNGAELIELIKYNDLEGIKCFEVYDVPKSIDTMNIQNFSDLSKLLGLYFRAGEIQEGLDNVLKCRNVKFSEIPAFREDIYFDLLDHGMDNEKAFRYMEFVRKGCIADERLTADEVEQFENDFRSVGMPQWYIDYCKHTRYLFPKAHGTEYTRLAVIEAWYKVHFRKEFDETLKAK